MTAQSFSTQRNLSDFVASKAIETLQQYGFAKSGSKVAPFEALTAVAPGSYNYTDEGGTTFRITLRRLSDEWQVQRQSAPADKTNDPWVVLFSINGQGAVAFPQARAA